MNIISENIPLNVEDIIKAIQHRQQLPWNNGRINNYNNFQVLQKLYEIINSGIPKEDFMFRGDLFRIHTSYVGFSEDVNSDKETIMSKICCDGSCSILPITEFSDSLVAFSKYNNFTRDVFYKVNANQTANIIYINTNQKYGIDVNALLSRFGMCNERYMEEHEVLFLLQQEYIIKEYRCSPTQLNYYLRHKRK